MYSEHNVIKNTKRMSNSWVWKKFYRKNQKAKTYQKSNLQIQTHETLQEQQFIIENTTKTIDSPLNTWNTYLEIRDIRLFSKFENNSHQDRICSFKFVSRSSINHKNTKPSPITVSSTILNAILLTTKTKKIFCLRVFNHHVILNYSTGTFEPNSIKYKIVIIFLLFNVYISVYNDF